MQLERGLKFGKALKSFSFALQRFDSLSQPLALIFSLLPEVIHFLGDLTRKGDVDDGKWARRVLTKLMGAGSWKDIMTAALAADCLLVTQKFLRLEDKAEAECYIKAKEACAVLSVVRGRFLGAFFPWLNPITMTGLRALAHDRGLVQRPWNFCRRPDVHPEDLCKPCKHWCYPLPGRQVRAGWSNSARIHRRAVPCVPHDRRLALSILCSAFSWV